MPTDSRTPYDVREVIEIVVDGGDYTEFKALYGTTLVTAFAHIHGHPVGIIANNGVLFSESALKGAHFIELCDKRSIPLVFLQNITGFMVGRAYEEGGIARTAPRWSMPFACARVPEVHRDDRRIVRRGQLFDVRSRLRPRFLWSWPNARISVMGGPQAADTLATVRRSQIERRGDSWGADAEEQFKEPIREQFGWQSDAYYSSARLWDDGVIDPPTPRTVLGLALETCRYAPLSDVSYGVFRM